MISELLCDFCRKWCKHDLLSNPQSQKLSAFRKNCPGCQFILDLLQPNHTFSDSIPDSVTVTLRRYFKFARYVEAYNDDNRSEDGDFEYAPPFVRITVNGNFGCDKYVKDGESLYHRSCGTFEILPSISGVSTDLNDESTSLPRTRRYPPQIDFSLVKRWIDICGTFHAGECESTPVSEILDRHKLWVIDVQRLTLCAMEPSYRFAALSYVWGDKNTPQLKLTADIFLQLQKPSGLKKLWNQIPLTIRDAIQVCQRLDIPYLWVDSICIEQDSPDLHSLLSCMNLIYSSAFLTIVAAFGHDSWTGLPGVADGSRKVERIERQIEGKCFIEGTPSFVETIEHCKWKTRAWTYQEGLFSKKMLIFTEHQAFYRCQTQLFCEDTDMEAADPPFSAMQHDMNSNMRNYRDAFEDYAKHVLAYSKTSITYPSDRLLAFASVDSVLSKRLKSEIFFGLPLKYMAETLGFSSMLNLRSINQSEDFPSWSWAAWCPDQKIPAVDAPFGTIVIASHFSERQPKAKFVHRFDGDIAVVKATQQKKGSKQIFNTFQNWITREGRRVERLFKELQFEKLSEKELSQLLVIETECVPEVTETDRYALPSEWFTTHGSRNPSQMRKIFQQLQFILLGWHRKQDKVRCMIIETDKRGVSTRVLAMSMEAKEWINRKRITRKVFLV